MLVPCTALQHASNSRPRTGAAEAANEFVMNKKPVVRGLNKGKASDPGGRDARLGQRIKKSSSECIYTWKYHHHRPLTLIALHQDGLHMQT